MFKKKKKLKVGDKLYFKHRIEKEIKVLAIKNGLVITDNIDPDPFFNKNIFSLEELRESEYYFTNKNEAIDLKIETYDRDIKEYEDMKQEFIEKIKRLGNEIKKLERMKI